MNFSELKELMTLFDESSIKEFDLENEEMSLYLSKNNGDGRQKNISLAGEQSVVIEKKQSQSGENLSEFVSGDASQVEERKEVEGKTVNSPIVGVVYLSSAPEEPVYKAVGDTVKVGDTLCIVEAMKIMNEITSDIVGKVVEVLVKNEEVVEYGQPLFRIG